MRVRRSRRHRLAVVVGDSIAITWIPLVQELLAPRGYRIQGLTMSGCPFVGTETRNPAANISAFCPDHKAAVVDDDPARCSRTSSSSPTPTGPGCPASRTSRPQRIAMPQGQLSIIEEIAAVDRCDLRAGAAAAGQGAGGVRDHLLDAGGLRLRHSGRLATLQRGDVRAAWRRVRTRPTSTPAAWFCTADGRCPSFVGHTPTRRDAAGHVVPAYAQRLAPLLAQILDPPGAERRGHPTAIADHCLSDRPVQRHLVQALHIDGVEKADELPFFEPEVGLHDGLDPVQMPGAGRPSPRRMRSACSSPRIRWAIMLWSCISLLTVAARSG